MGLGKTATSLGVIGVLMGLDGAALIAAARARRSIICCPAGLVPIWLQEMKKWLKPTARVAARFQNGGAPHLTPFAAVGDALQVARRQRRAARLTAHRQHLSHNDHGRGHGVGGDSGGGDDDDDVLGLSSSSSSSCDAVADDDDAIARFERCPLEQKPVLVISYESYRDHAPRLNALRDVGLLVCDEAHRLKGSDDKTQVVAAIRASPAQRRLLLSATPVQNGLHELQRLLELCDDGGDKAENPLRPRDDAAGRIETDLAHRLKRSTLRRTVDDCAALKASLPLKTEMLVVCRATEFEYAAHAALDAGEAEPNNSADAWALRRVNAARLVSSSPAAAADRDVAESGKWIFVARLLRALWAAARRQGDEAERVIVVSQFSRVLDAGEALCGAEGWPCARLDGRATPDARAAIVARLNSPRGGPTALRAAAAAAAHGEDPAVVGAPFVTLLSLRAGGVGLTLTGASRLVLFDPSWNPADDDQAVARIWRDGQTRPVFVYRLALARSIEERILHRQVLKAQIADGVKRCQVEALLDDGGRCGSSSSSSSSSSSESSEDQLAVTRSTRASGAAPLADLVALRRAPAAAPSSELYEKVLAAHAGDGAAAARAGWPAFDPSATVLARDAALRAAAAADVAYARHLEASRRAPAPS